MDQTLSSLRHAPPVDDDFLREVVHGLSRRQKRLPSRFFYDARGSELFEQITELPEYYPTRTEIALLKTHAAMIGRHIGAGATVVEFGSGSSRKTGILLDTLDSPSAYIPIEISAAALYPAARRIQAQFPNLDVHPILGGFHDLHKIRLPAGSGFRLGFFPGSTIGNLTRPEALAFLRSARTLLGRHAAFLIGADLKKSLDILLPAYNDAQGVTAAFNLNILHRINRELAGSFDPAAFSHEAIYNEPLGRIEMHLRSLNDQQVAAGGRSFAFAPGETIHTENSHKYTVPEFSALAAASGWQPLKTWVDENCLFSLHLLA
jgi:L-histidine N-alpha-methyltransferase